MNLNSCVRRLPQKQNEQTLRGSEQTVTRARFSDWLRLFSRWFVSNVTLNLESSFAVNRDMILLSLGGDMAPLFLAIVGDCLF